MLFAQQAEHFVLIHPNQQFRGYQPRFSAKRKAPPERGLILCGGLSCSRTRTTRQRAVNRAAELLLVSKQPLCYTVPVRGATNSRRTAPKAVGSSVYGAVPKAGKTAQRNTFGTRLVYQK